MDIRTGVLRLPQPRSAAPARLAVGALCALLAVIAAVVGAPGEASAQNTLVSTEPSDGDTVETSPNQIVLEFEEPVGSANRVDASCNSNPVTGLAQPVLSDGDRTLTVAVLRPLPQGTCVVSWRVSESTGQPGATGTFTFEVASAPTTTAAAADTTPGTATATTGADTGTPDDDVAADDDESEVADIGTFDNNFALWAGRFLSILGLSIVFGSLLLLAVAWPEGPEYVIAVRFIRSAWVLGLVGSVLFVAAARASATGESFVSSLNPLEWADLLDAGWPGRAALARLLLAIATGWVAALPERAVEPSTQFPSLAISGLAVATFGLSRTGGDLAALGVAMGLVHAVAAAVWLGGVIFVSRIVLAGSGEEDLVHATRGFSRIALPALAFAVVSGLVQLIRLDGGSLFSETHGRILLIKTVVVAVVVFVAMSVHQVVQARLSRARALSAPMANRLRRAFGIDALLGVVVIGLSASLLQYTPANVDADSDDVPDQVVRSINQPDAGIDMEVVITPGRVGENQMTVKVFEPETGLRGLEVTLVPPEGTQAPTITQAIPLTGRGMAYMTEGDTFPLAVPGSWRLEVSASTDEGSISQAGGAFDVRLRSGELVEPAGDTGTTTTATVGSTSSTVGSTTGASVTGTTSADE